MKSPIERIIYNDKRAREKVAEAEEYRKNSAEDLEIEKAKIEESLTKEARGAAESAMERSEKESCRLTEEYRRSAGMICARMEEMYREKKNEWVETYTRRVIEGD